MNVELNCNMSPMYEYLWTAVIGFACYGEETPIIISNRLALLVGNNGTFRWLHICHPRKLKRLLECHLKDLALSQAAMESWAEFEVYCNTRLNFTPQLKCGRCKYELNKTEQLLLKLSVIGVKR